MKIKLKDTLPTKGYIIRFYSEFLEDTYGLSDYFIYRVVSVKEHKSTRQNGANTMYVKLQNLNTGRMQSVVYNRVFFKWELIGYSKLNERSGS